MTFNRVASATFVMLVVAVFLLANASSRASAMPSTGQGRPIHRAPLPVCAMEDASSGPVPCVWIGTLQGNGRGHSFRVYKRVNPVTGDHVFKIISANRAFELAGECDSTGPIYCRGA